MADEVTNADLVMARYCEICDTIPCTNYMNHLNLPVRATSVPEPEPTNREIADALHEVAEHAPVTVWNGECIADVEKRKELRSALLTLCHEHGILSVFNTLATLVSLQES